MPQRHVPRPTPETQVFWEGTRARELRLRRCGACEAVWLPTQTFCPACGGSDVSTFAASGRGQLYSYVISHLPSPGRETPLTIAVVELDEGPRLLTNLVDIEPDPAMLPIDLPVEVAFEELTDEITLPVFRPRASSR